MFTSLSNCQFGDVEMAENARRWSREKTDLSVQLQEARHGLARQSLPHRLSPIPVHPVALLVFLTTGECVRPCALNWH